MNFHKAFNLFIDQKLRRAFYGSASEAFGLFLQCAKKST